MNTTTTTLLPRFRTLGGATVQMRPYRFTTRYLPDMGRPHIGDTQYEVDGFIWQCLGCGITSTEQLVYSDGYLPWESPLAREHANEHASECRSMPAPDDAADELEGRVEILRIASRLTDLPAAYQVNASFRVLLAWLTNATSPVDSEARREALRRWQANRNMSDRQVTAEEALSEVEPLYKLLTDPAETILTANETPA